MTRPVSCRNWMRFVMPKQKTHKGLAKRVKVTGRGKVKRRRAFTGHLMSGRPGKQRRRLRQPTLMPKAEEQRCIKALNP
jgi:large subunit ribosomal protein L35